MFKIGEEVNLVGHTGTFIIEDIKNNLYKLKNNPHIWREDSIMKIFNTIYYNETN